MNSRNKIQKGLQPVGFGFQMVHRRLVKIKIYEEVPYQKQSMSNFIVISYLPLQVNPALSSWYPLSHAQ